jgi:hypothetical protein
LKKIPKNAFLSLPLPIKPDKPEPEMAQEDYGLESIFQKKVQLPELVVPISAEAML